MTAPRKKPAVPFNKAAENYIKDPSDVTRAIAALRARKPDHRTAREKARAEVEAHFTSYHNVLAPFIDALQKLPAKNGLEFFARADLYQSAKSRQDSIHIWLLYGRAAEDSGAGTPSTHDVAVSPKAEDTKRRYTHVALSTRPVLEIEMRPAKGETEGYTIQSRIYTERYMRQPDGMPPSTPTRGGFVSNNEIIEERSHTALKNTLQAMDSWLQRAAPERRDEIRAALGILDTPELKDDVSVLRPATLRRRR